VAILLDIIRKQCKYGHREENNVNNLREKKIVDSIHSSDDVM